MDELLAPPSARPTLRSLLVLAVPAVLIGVLSALVLWSLDEVSLLLEHWVWSAVPAALGFAADSWWWILGILSLTGLAVGLVVKFAPGHGGVDSATVELFAPILPLRALPSVAAVLILGLAGGVSLGPEGPIIAINTAIAVVVLRWLMPTVPPSFALTITAAGTVGAMFGTPVAAALVFTGFVAAAAEGGELWDRLFLPLAAAGSGALTMILIHGEQFAMKSAPYAPQLIDLATGTVVAIAAAGLGMLAAVAFPHVHRLFHSIGNPLLYITLGGITLGVLGIIGGPIILFKGLNQTAELVANPDGFAPLQLVLIVAVKLVALVVAASAGFRGGRIFPAVFIGVAVGLLGHSLMPSLPAGLAIGCGVLGIVLVVGRDGWLALFLAVAVAGDVATLPILCVIVLPAWLVARNAPHMIIPAAQPTAPVSAPDD